MTSLSEDTLAEQPTLEWFRELGYEYAFGPDISPGGSRVERGDFTEVVLKDRLETALQRLNPHLPTEALEDAMSQLMHLDSPNLNERNCSFHRMAVKGVPVIVRDKEGNEKGDRARVLDFDEPENNDFLVVNQLTVIDGEHNRRPDIIIYVNGLPLGVVEVKNPAGPEKAIDGYRKNFRKYLREIPDLFNYNEIMVTSDLLEAKHGTITARWEWYTPWKQINEDEKPPEEYAVLETLIKGIFPKKRFFDIIQNFISFEIDGEKIEKKMVMYHQYFGVKKAVKETLRAASTNGNRKIGIIWHTQGSGKSLSMVFYTSLIIKQPEMENPTIVVLTDRNDLDQQIYDTFQKATDLIPYPKQAESIEDLKEKLNIPAGGIIFTTIQKFSTKDLEDYPLISERRNIVVIADEAHRTQYRTLAGNVRNALPNASFIGFTGTPIEFDDRSTRVTFGDYISTYKMTQSREDGNTVPIYYESRLAKIHLTNEFIDEEFEEVTEKVEDDILKEKLKSKWARLEALAGAEDRVTKIVNDLVEHFNNREIKGKALIVAMSRRIAVKIWELLQEIEDAPESAVIISAGSDDPDNMKKHHRSKQEMEELKARFKDPKDPLKMVVVRDMWLTGFDAPVLHTMYVDKPMRDHNLMQAIARVNRVFKDKPGGLIVDYIGIADDLRKSLRVYTDEVQKESMISIEVAISIMQEKYEIVCTYFNGIDFKNWHKLKETDLARLMQKAHNTVTKDDEIIKGFLKQCTSLTKAFALVSPHEEATKIRRDVLFFQSVKRSVRKYTPSSKDVSEDIDTAIKQLVSEGVSSDEVIDIFGFKEKDKPDISILSNEFLNDIQKIEYKNLQVRVLEKLLNDEITGKMKKNIITYRSFKKMLEETITRYKNRSIQSAEVIERLVKMAEELKEVEDRGLKLGLSNDELAFYDAVSKGREYIEKDEQLLEFSRELVATIKRNLSIDWADREQSKSKIRANVKRLLRKKGFKPKEYEPFMNNIMDQAVNLYRNWPMAEA